MSTCRACEIPLDCGAAGQDIYSLQEDTYFYQIAALGIPLDTLYMDCCDGVRLKAIIPVNSTQAVRDAILQNLVAEYWRRWLLCQTADDGAPDDPGDNPVGDPTDPDDPLRLYYNQVAKCTANCPDGTPFTYTVPRGVFIQPSQSAADDAARDYACQMAAQMKVCIGTLPRICEQVPVILRIPVTGNTGGEGMWQFVSGTLPPGMILATGNVSYDASCFYHSGTSTWYKQVHDPQGGWVLIPCTPIVAPNGYIMGTPTTAGTYTFTVRLITPTGFVITKLLTLIVNKSIVDAVCKEGYGTVTVCVGEEFEICLVLGDCTVNAQNPTLVVGGAFPPGVNWVGGKLVGHADVVGTYGFEIRAPFIFNGGLIVENCGCDIISDPVGPDEDTLPEGDQGEYYDVTLDSATEDFVPPLKFEIVDGALPSGLTLNETTGEITGCPLESGDFTVRIKLSDGAEP